jgi:hypothetical protein
VPIQRGLLAALLSRVVPGRRSSEEEAPSTTNIPESGAQDVVTAGPARRLDPTLAAAGSVLEPSDPSPPVASFVLPAPVLQATSSVLPSLDTIPVASNTRPGAPLANQGNNPYSCILDGQRPKDRSLMKIWAPLNRSFPQNQEL